MTLGGLVILSKPVVIKQIEDEIISTSRVNVTIK